MTTAAVRHLGCPACGATLARREDQRAVRCRSCGSRCALVGVEAWPRFQLVPAIDAVRAQAIVRGALARYPVREGTSESAAVVSTELYWVPFQEFEALQAGTVVRDRGEQTLRGGRLDWTSGTRRFVDDAGHDISEDAYYRRRTVSGVDTAVVLRTHRETSLAGGSDAWGLRAIELPRLLDDAAVRVVPFGAPQAPRGHVLPPRRGRSETEAAVRRLAEGVSGANTDGLRRTDRPDVSASGRHASGGGAATMDFLAPEVRYVFVPVWVVRYRVERHPYTFVVDAVEGRVLSGRAPEAPRRGALFLVLAAAYLGFPIGKSVAVAAAISEASAVSPDRGSGAIARLLVDAPILVLVAAAFLMLPLAVAWGEFRFRGEVAFGPDGPYVVKLSRPARTWIERVIDWLVEKTEDLVDMSRRDER